MPIHLVCQCGARVIAPTKRAGQSIRCPKCDGRISVPLGEGQEASSFSSPTRTSRLDSAIADLVTARHTDAPVAPKSPIPKSPAPKSPEPKRIERIDPPEEKLRPKQPLPVSAPILVPAQIPAPAPISVQPPAPLPALLEASPRVAIAPSTRPISEMSTITLESPPKKSAQLKQELSPKVRIVTSTRRVQTDKGWLGAIYGLALLWSTLATVGVLIACAESYFYFRAEELWRFERWALLVIAASAVQVALAIYMVQVADWIACRSASVVISCIAAAEAMILAVTLFSKNDGWFARFLDLTPHMQNHRALGFALLLTLLSVLLAYSTASVSLAWQREEERRLKPRAVN